MHPPVSGMSSPAAPIDAPDGHRLGALDITSYDQVPGFQGSGVLFQILPYIEQDNARYEKAWQTDNAPVPLYNCPSRRGLTRATGPYVGAYVSDYVWPCGLTQTEARVGTPAQSLASWRNYPPKPADGRRASIIIPGGIMLGGNPGSSTSWWALGPISSEADLPPEIQAEPGARIVKFRPTTPDSIPDGTADSTPDGSAHREHGGIANAMPSGSTNHEPSSTADGNADIDTDVLLCSGAGVF
jgi:hypothetical protein